MDDLSLLTILGSASRQRILDLLAKGVDHPEDLAERLELRRQSVDKQLLELYAYAFVDRSAIFPPTGRPRIVYRVSERGRELLERLGALMKEYLQGMEQDFQRGLSILEDKLAAGELDEKSYLQQREILGARYARLLGNDEVSKPPTRRL